MSITVYFDKEKDTKNTVKFAERERDDGPPVMGTAYVQKYVLKQLGNPNSIKLTIETE